MSLGRIGGRAYVVSGEEERLRRGRSRLDGLCWDTNDCTRGRDWDPRFLLWLKKTLSK